MTAVRRSPRLVAAALAAITLQLAGPIAASPTPPAHVDEIRTNYTLQARAYPRTICVDGEGSVDVRLRAVVSGRRNPGDWMLLPRAGPGNMADAPITARARSDVLRLSETERVTGLHGHGTPGEANAVFDYKGLKVGDSQIAFEVPGTAGTDLGWPGVLTAAETSVDIKVINCKFVLHAFSTFVLEGEAGLTFGTAMTNVELTQSDDGQLRQSVSVSWFAWVGGVGDCFGQLTANTSEAAVFGKLDDQGVLTVDVEYEPFHVQLASNCGGFSTDVTPSALHFEADSRGDSGRLEQDLSSPLGGVPGAASWVIIATDEP
jgi:hypothetical protein